VLERLVRKGKGLLLQAQKDGELVGALCMVFVGGTAVYMMGGMRRSFSKLFPSEFLHMSAMRLARERGLQTYDLNNWGSASGAQFKRGFRPAQITWATPRSMVFRPMTTNLMWESRSTRARPSAGSFVAGREAGTLADRDS
jgi:CelD/BcsL family acetyltransferase involved in cellulose biosynthesis